ncbi:MAG: hypothetical protein J6D87_02920 [Clostridia bacterium]|nr:hypothetical protein [Clostridia bacterium]
MGKLLSKAQLLSVYAAPLCKDKKDEKNSRPFDSDMKLLCGRYPQKHSAFYALE